MGGNDGLVIRAGEVCSVSLGFVCWEGDRLCGGCGLVGLGFAFCAFGFCFCKGMMLQRMLCRDCASGGLGLGVGLQVGLDVGGVPCLRACGLAKV